MDRHYEPPEDVTGTIFDPTDETFGPILAALQSGDFERAAELVAALAGSRRRILDFVYVVEPEGRDVDVFENEDDADRFATAHGGTVDEQPVFFAGAKATEGYIAEAEGTRG